MAAPPPHAPPRTQRIEPAFFRSDPFQPTVMLDLHAGAYLGRAAGTTPPPPRAGRGAGFALFVTMASMIAVALAASLTYWVLLETMEGRAVLAALLQVIEAPIL